MKTSPFIILILILALVGIIIAVGKESYRKHETDKEIFSLKTEVQELQDKNKLLTDLLDYFNSDKSLEKEARLKLNLSKEGEKLVVIGAEKKNSSENQPAQKTNEEQHSNFEKWWEYLRLDALFGK